MRALPAAGSAALLLLTVIVALLLAPAGRAAPSPSHWCGPGEATTDLPDSVGNAFQVHVVYAYPADGTDRFSTFALGIARDVAALDTWWRAQDQNHAPRWDLASFAGCDTAYGQLDITVARLPQPTGYYASLDSVLPRLAEGLLAAPFNLSDPDKKYVVFYDGLLLQPGGGYSVCGQSPTVVQEGGGADYAGVFLGSPCGDGLGTATNVAATLAHELIHNLGALAASGPPHPCPTTPSHPCDSNDDVMAPSVEGGRILTELQLDVGRDDYYGHSGSWWDVQDSAFLERVGQALGSPTAVAGLTATNSAGDVTLRWQPATSPNGAVTYRVYRDDALLGTVTKPAVLDPVSPGSTHTWAIRAQDPLGFYSAPATLTYTLATGTPAPAAGTPAPAAGGSSPTPRAAAAAPTTPLLRPPTHLRWTRTSTGILLRWTAPPGKVARYRVVRDGKTVSQFVTGTSLAVPRARAKGRWVVYAMSTAGIASRPSVALRIR